MRPRRGSGFTLVELLVVIGIIAILISILLPGLTAARRSGNTIKCLSNLRQVGQAFAMYSQEFKGVYPVAVHDLAATHIKIGQERRWYDLLGEYVTNRKFVTSTDIAKIRRQSVIWGCPEWVKTEEFDPNRFADKVRPGYGMQYYPTYFKDYDLSNLAYVTSGRGRYVKQSRWSRPEQRGLVADSITHILGTPTTFGPNGLWFPYDYNQMTNTGIPAGTFYVDAGRHGRRNLNKQQSYRTKCINMLYCDGHAATVSVKEAYLAIANPGENRAPNGALLN